MNYFLINLITFITDHQNPISTSVRSQTVRNVLAVSAAFTHESLHGSSTAVGK